MKKYRKRTAYMDYIWIVVGTGIVAFAINCMYEPNQLVIGGFGGIGIILKSLTKGVVDGGIPLWFTNIILNAPVFLIGFKIKGKDFIGRTLIATVAVSIWLFIIPSKPFIADNLFLACVFGGAIQGVGMGLVFATKATTGGTDMVAALIQTKLKEFSVAKLMMAIDAVIVIIGGYAFGVERALYAVISILVISKISDGIIEGLKFAKAAYIITDKYEEVSAEILKSVNRGLTGIYAKGMYTGQERYLLFCVVTKKELVQLKEIVSKIDEHAFVIVSDAREVVGEGFLPME